MPCSYEANRVEIDRKDTRVDESSRCLQRRSENSSQLACASSIQDLSPLNFGADPWINLLAFLDWLEALRFLWINWRISHPLHVTWSEIACPANQHPKSTIKKERKPTNLCTTRISQKKRLPCLIMIQSRYLDYRINKMFACSLCGLSFALRALDLDVDLDELRAQRIIGFLITHKPTRS